MQIDVVVASFNERTGRHALSTSAHTKNRREKFNAIPKRAHRVRSLRMPENATHRRSVTFAGCANCRVVSHPSFR